MLPTAGWLADDEFSANSSPSPFLPRRIGQDDHLGNRLGRPVSPNATLDFLLFSFLKPNSRCPALTVIANLYVAVARRRTLARVARDPLGKVEFTKLA